MCECGCGDFSPSFQFPGPDNKVYTIEVKSPCRSCGAPAGVAIELLTPEGMAEWEAHELPVLKFHGAGNMAYSGLPILDTHELVKKLQEIWPDAGTLADDIDQAVVAVMAKAKHEHAQ